jgi:hypothetical protein
MGVRTRGLDIAIGAKRQVADAAARAEAKGVRQGRRTVNRDLLPRHAMPFGTPMKASNVDSAGVSRTARTERQRPLGPYLLRANWTANSWAACAMSAARTEDNPSQMYWIAFILPRSVPRQRGTSRRNARSVPGAGVASR